jgi:hypothetical protein
LAEGDGGKENSQSQQRSEWGHELSI